MTDKTQEKLNEMLSEAASLGRATEVVDLLEKGADVNNVNSERRTPLMRAAYKGHMDVVQALLAAGADKTLRDSSNETAEDDARNKNFRDIENLLREYVYNPDEIIFQRPLGDRTLQESFNFVSLERISLIRNGKRGPVEAITYTSFENVTDQDTLRKAFEEHVKRGGKADEAIVFPNRLFKSVLKREG